MTNSTPVTETEAAKATYQARGGRGFSTIPQTRSVTDVKSLSPSTSGVGRVGSFRVLSSSAVARLLMGPP